MRYIEKHPMIMIVVGVLGISLSSIFVKYSTAPSAVTAAYRLLWTVLLMTPVTFGSKEIRTELLSVSRATMLLSCLSGLFLAIHFTLWFESLRHTSVATFHYLQQNLASNHKKLVALFDRHFLQPYT